MKTIVFLISLIFVSCNIDNKCGEFLKLNSDIYIYGYSENYTPIKKAILNEYNNAKDQSESKTYNLKNIVNPFTGTNGDELYLPTNGIFKTNKTYKLILNDSIVFNITDFVIENAKRGTAVKVQEHCILKSYKVNQQGFDMKNNHLRFNKSLGKIE